MADSSSYFFESVDGILWEQGSVVGLSIGRPVPTDAEVLMEGRIVLRYGIELLQQPYAMVPGYFESENGYIKTGRAAWDFIWSKFQLYPRADVIGLRSDGTQLQVYMRDLDFGEWVKVLAYEDENAEAALGMVNRLETAPDTVLPELLAQYAGTLR